MNTSQDEKKIVGTIVPKPESAKTKTKKRVGTNEANLPTELHKLINQAQELDQHGDTEGAEKFYAQWIHKNENAIGKKFALFNYAAILQKLNKLDEALAAYQSCIELDENFGQAYINQGLLYEKKGMDTPALQTWASWISKWNRNTPKNVELQTITLNHLGRVQERLKNYQQANNALGQSLKLNPKQPGVIQHYVHIRQKACAWPIYKKLEGISYAQMRQATSPLAMLALTEDPAEQLANSMSFVLRTYQRPNENLIEGRTYKHERIRIGYVSCDLREHAVGFLLGTVFEGHDPKKYELYAYDYTAEEKTEQRSKLKKHFEHIRPIHKLTDREAAIRIKEDEIDILIDLHGLSAGARPGILSYRPALKQGTYLGFIGPTGMPWIDFVIADPICLPSELTPYFTETPIYLNESFIPLTLQEMDQGLTDRKALGFEEQDIILASLSNTYKITPEMFEVWMNILKRIKIAKLWLIDDNAESTKNLTNEAAHRGISRERLIFQKRVNPREYRRNLKVADIFLDTYPYNCGSTTNDVVNAGIPIVTKFGKTMVSRMGYSILNSIGKTETVTNSDSAYEEQVVMMCLKIKAGNRSESEIRKYYPTKMEVALNQLKTNDLYTGYRAITIEKTKKEFRIYQIYYNDETRQSIPSGFIPLNNIKNERPDWREFWPIRNFLISNTLEDDIYYGFFSPRFSEKTGLDPKKVHEFIQQCDAENQLIHFSPYWDMNSFFLNSFVQGDFFHPGLLDVYKTICQKLKLNINPEKIVTHAGDTVFCNYFIAKKSFWTKWLELAEEIFLAGESPEENLYVSMNQNRNRDSYYSQDSYPLKIFVQERLVNLVLAISKLPSKDYNIFDLGATQTPLSNYMTEAIYGNALKAQYINTGNKIYLDSYITLNQRVWEKSGIIALAQQLDKVLAKQKNQV